MTRYLQAIHVLALLQLLCLGLGLWVQDRLLLTTASWEARRSDPQAGIVTVESILAALPSVRLLTLLWTGGLQLVAVYLLIQRLRGDHVRAAEQARLEFARQEKELIRTRNAVIFGLAGLAESRDRETGTHLERISQYSTQLAAALRTDPHFKHLVTPMLVRSIGISSVLHDIGKVGVPDSILLKPGSLSPEERHGMQRHTVIGSDCLEQIEKRLGSGNFLHSARLIALYHHERWDGQGYPHGLRGEQIPLAARIVAVADIYDALSVRRVYKEAYPHERCVEIIRQEAGKHLDPAIVEVFLRIEGEFAAIARRYRDAAGELPPPPEHAPTPTPIPESQSGQEHALIASCLDLRHTLEQALEETTLAPAKR